MSTDLPKAYDPKDVEPEANRVWTDEKLFHAEPTDPGEPYSIVIPPPNVTAALHLGHALNNTLQDILTRWRRMAGDNAMWMPGTDHAGIATQTVVDKRLQAQGEPALKDYKLMEVSGQHGREQFIAKVQAWKDEYEKRITNQLKTMGCSCDWDRQAFTMDEPRARAVREAFFQLFKDGLIYRGKRLVNWDPATQTALADDEVEMEEIDGHFYYLRYPIEPETSPRDTGVPPVRDARGAGESSATDKSRTQHGQDARVTGAPAYITVATTRPETMLGDTAVAINPKDPRAAALRGKKIRLPIVNRVVPIIEDDYVVLPDPKSDDAKARFATGFLKVTPAHDPNDYDIGLRHKLPMINVLAPDGTISRQHGWPADDCEQGDAEFLFGLDRFEARRAIVEWFKKNNLLEEVRPYRHSVGHSYRSHVPIEPYLSDQWYCKVTDERLAGAALRAMSREQYDTNRDTGVPPVRVASGVGEPSTSDKSRNEHGQDARVTGNWESQLTFYPARYARTFQTWHENIRDWCISRQLWWGHRIPVWRLPEGRLADRLSQDQFIAVIETMTQWSREGRMALTHRAEDPKAREQDISDRKLPFAFACVRDLSDREIIDELERHGAEQDPDVLDTWFSSGLWPMSTLGWPEQTPELEKWNPTSVLTTAREIITLWVSRMVMFNLYFLDRLPFRDVFIHAMIQDGEGRKMSKSLGNGVDPLDIIDSHGSDAMRFTLTLMTTQTQDVRMPVERDAKSGKNTSPKFDIGRNFVNKLWNASRFAMMNLGGEARRHEGTKARTEGEGDEVSVNALSSSPSSLTSCLRAFVPSCLPDQWILSRFNRTVVECDAALKEYRFDQYAKACYDFFWRDFCDWYLEAIKPAMKDPSRAPQTATVLAAVLDGSLRLMHPMIPFITETIWWKLNELRPQRGVPGILECPPSKRLIKAAWPKVTDFHEAAESIFPKLQETIGAIRNLRNEHKVEPKRTVTVTIVAAPEPARQIAENREIIELLATCTIKGVGPDAKAPDKAARATAAGVEIYIEGMVDEAAEQQRSAKRCEELKKQIAALQGRLSNESYTKKAPPNLVKQTQDQLAEAEAESAKLGCA